MAQIRLETGVELRKGVVAAGGSDDDIALVLQEAPDFISAMAAQLIERAHIIRGDKECFRLTDPDIVIPMPALKRPTLAKIQMNRSWIKKIECDDSPEHPVTLRLATVLKSTETQIDDPAYKARLARCRNKNELLGFQHMQWLIKHQNDAKAIPDQKARAALKDLLGKAYIDFPGIIVVVDDGSRSFPYALQGGERWDEYWHWISDDFHAHGRFAVFSK